MTNRRESGAGSLDGDDLGLDGGLSAGSDGDTLGSLGSSGLGESDFDTARGDTLGLGVGGDIGSGPDLGGSIGGAMTGGAMGGGGLSSGGGIDSMTPSNPDIGGTLDVGATSGDRTGVSETTSGAGGSGGGLPGVAMGALAGAAIGAAASALLGSGGQKERSSSIERDIEVNAPLRAVYNQWTQFEEFPQFMQGVERVQQLDDKRMHWHAELGFKDKEWDAEIVDQVPDQRITWRSTSGAPNGGTVSFQSVGANRTRVTLRLDYDPEGLIENVGDTLGVVSRRVEGDLERFKTFIEARGAETGGWRGEIHRGQ